MQPSLDAGDDASGGAHVPASLRQTSPSVQSASVAHVVLHVPLMTSQRYGAHETEVPSAAIDDARSAEHADVAALHSPPWHRAPAAQSASVVHDVLHWLSPHAYGAHAIVSGALHAPVAHDEAVDM